MSETSRRSFLSNSALAGIALPHVHVAQNSTVQIALVGCGGRGTGAAVNALSVTNGPVKLVAMADVVPAKMNASYDKLKSQFEGLVDVPPERRFLGYDAYKKAMDSMKSGDVVILGTPPAFRWVQFTHAIDKGLHTFMEKPVTVDGPTTKRMLALNELAKKKNLKVGVGLMVRHCRARQELLKRIRDGQIGDIVAMRGYRMGQGGGTAGPRPEGVTELAWQSAAVPRVPVGERRGVQRLLHSPDRRVQLDEGRVAGGGARSRRAALPGRLAGSEFRHVLGAVHVPGRDKAVLRRPKHEGGAGRVRQLRARVEGLGGDLDASRTRRASRGSTRARRCRRVTDRKQLPLPEDSNLVWAYPQPEKSPYQWEWDDLMEAIRQDKPYNEAQRGAEASLVASMGRMAAHTGQIITFDQMLNCPHEFAPNVDKLTMDGPAPLQMGADGKYPVPEPGIKIDREY